MLRVSPSSFSVMRRALSDRFSSFDSRQEPEIACELAGPLATRVASPLPETEAALVSLRLENSTINVLPSGGTVHLEVATILPCILTVCSME